MDMGQGAEVQSVQRGGPRPVQDVTMYMGGTDVPMTQLHAGPTVPPGMSSVQAPPPVEPRQVGALEQAARAFDADDAPMPDVQPVERQAIRRPVEPAGPPPGLGQPPSAARTAQMNVAAHRRMGLRTVNQQPRFDSAALQAAQPEQVPLRGIRGIVPPPFMRAGTAQIRQDVGADPRGRGRPVGPKKVETPGFGPMKKPRGVRWGDTGRDPLMRALASRQKQQQWEQEPPVQQAVQQSLTDEEKRQEAERRRQGPYGPGTGVSATGPLVPGKKPPKPGPLPPPVPGPTKKPFKKPRRGRRVTFGGYESRTIPNVLREREDRKEYMAAGRHLGIKQGRQEASRQHRMTVAQMQRQNNDLIGLVKGMQREGQTLQARVKVGGRQLAAREDAIKQLQVGQGQQGFALQTAQARIKRGGEQISARDVEITRLNQEGKRLETKAATRVSELEEAHGRAKDIAVRRGARIGSLKAEGRMLLQQRDARIANMADEARRLQDEVRQARAAGSADSARLESDLAAAKASLAEARRAPKAAPAGAPIITVSAPGGGGASSSSSAGGAAAAPAAAAPDLSKVVEAVKKIAESVTAAKKKEPAGKAGKGITQARRRYTDKRKITLAALRSLKSKRIRQFNTKTKTMPKAERDKQRREFKNKVNAQYKEVTTKFPTARGMKSVATIRELIKKLEGIKTGS